jgi:hypothetical protein
MYSIYDDLAIDGLELKGYSWFVKK